MNRERKYSVNSVEYTKKLSRRDAEVAERCFCFGKTAERAVFPKSSAPRSGNSPLLGANFAFSGA